MTIALWCLLGAILMPYLFTGIAKVTAARAMGTYDNANPRAFLAQAEGMAARADNAQLNSFEAMPGFIAGVLTATYLGMEQGTLDLLAISWIVLRLIYGACYLTGIAALRTLVWTGALGVVVAMFVMAA